MPLSRHKRFAILCLMTKKFRRVALLLLISVLLAVTTIKVSSTMVLTNDNYSSSMPAAVLSPISIDRPSTSGYLCAASFGILGRYTTTKAGWPIPYNYKHPLDPDCGNLDGITIRSFYPIAFAADVLLFGVVLFLLSQLVQALKTGQNFFDASF